MEDFENLEPWRTMLSRAGELGAGVNTFENGNWPRPNEVLKNLRRGPWADWEANLPVDENAEYETGGELEVAQIATSKDLLGQAQRAAQTQREDVGPARREGAAQLLRGGMAISGTYS